MSECQAPNVNTEENIEANQEQIPNENTDQGIGPNAEPNPDHPTPNKKEHVNYEVVFFIRYHTIGRPDAEQVSLYFSKYGQVHHVNCPQNKNYAFVFMLSLNTSSTHRRTRNTINQIVAEMTPENHFHITVASSNRGNQRTRPPYQNFYQRKKKYQEPLRRSYADSEMKTYQAPYRRSYEASEMKTYQMPYRRSYEEPLVSNFSCEENRMDSLKNCQKKIDPRFLAWWKGKWW